MQSLFNRYVIYLITSLCFILVVLPFLSNPHFFDSSFSFYFNEFIQSNNLWGLFIENVHAYNDRLMRYNIGLPIPPQNETVFGTNNGLRIVPLLLFLSLLQNIFGSLWDRVFLLVTLCVPLVTFLLSLHLFKVKVTKTSAIVSALFFSFNPWIFIRLETGFWQLHIAYAMFPLLFFGLFHCVKSKEKNDVLRSMLFVIFSASVMFWFQPHFLVMIVPVLGVILFSHLRDKDVWKRIGIILILFILLNSYYIVPPLISPPHKITVPSQEFSLASVGFNGKASTLANILRLTPRNILNEEAIVMSTLDYINVLVHVVILILIILNTVNLMRRRKRRNTEFVLLTLLIFYIFLAKGLNKPYIEVSKLIYSHLPFMQIFRDPSRFYAVIIFIVTLLIVSIRDKSRFLKFGMIALIPFIIYSAYSSALKSSKLLGYVSIPYTRYSSISFPEITNERILVFPNSNLKYYSWMPKGTTGTHNTPYDALLPNSPNLALFSGYSDSYSTQLLYFVQQKLLLGEPVHNLLNRLQVKYILVDNDIKSDTPEFSFIQNSNKIFKEIQFSLISQKDGLSLYKSSLHPSLFTTAEPIFIVGDLNLYQKVSQLIPLHTPLVLLNQKENINSVLNKPFKNKIIMYDSKNTIASAYYGVFGEYSLHLEDEIWHYDKDWQLYEPFKLKDVSDGVVFLSGRSIKSHAEHDVMTWERHFSEGKYHILINIIKDVNNGKLKIDVDDKSFTIPLTSHKKEMTGVYLGSLKLDGKTPITLQNVSQTEITIDDVYIVPDIAYQQYSMAYSNLLSTNKTVIANSFKTEQVPPAVEFTVKKNDYADYKINTTGSFISVQMPYDSNWSMNNQKPYLISDYYGMTFEAKEEINTLTYHGESIQRITLIVSAITFIGVCYLFYTTSNKRNTAR